MNWEETIHIYKFIPWAVINYIDGACEIIGQKNNWIFL